MTATMVELRLLLPASLVEEVSDALMEVDALSVVVEDADADTPDEAPIFGEPGMPATLSDQIRGWQRSVLKALFPNESDATEAATWLLSQGIQDLHVQAMEPVVEQDWVRVTQSQFAPVPITETFWIVPTWHAPPPGATQVMRLDPGMAFGTGTHPTTRMCLRWMARHAESMAPSWSRVLDYGCGSGILAIGAGLLGAQGIDAVDIDPLAVDATRVNAEANGVGLQAVGLPDAAQGEYPLVLANILAIPLKLLAPLLSSHVAPGGHLVLAGLLERQVEELQAAYAPGLHLEVADAEEGWVLLTAQRKTV